MINIFKMIWDLNYLYWQNKNGWFYKKIMSKYA